MAPEQAAAVRTLAHRDTPTIAHFDALGRSFLTIARNRKGDGTIEELAKRVTLDIEGNQREVIDAKDRIVMRYDYDMLGNRIHQASMEAGARWMLNDVTGKPIHAWDSRGRAFRTEYDALRRPVRSSVDGASATRSDPRVFGKTIVFEKVEYGDGQDPVLNLRARLFRHFDEAGIITSRGKNPKTGKDEAYDFKGNLLRSSRQLVEDYKNPPDWTDGGAVPALEPEVFASSTTYDALNRPVEGRKPDGSITRPSFNEANFLDRLQVNLRGSATATPFVTNIYYDAKGQRTAIDYGNGARTEYAYDDKTFRLVHLKTTRGAAFPAGERSLQDLHYTYDPASNITYIRDDAQQTTYFNGAVAKPHSDYVYDALYRLIQAKGREHAGTANRPWTTYDDAGRTALGHKHAGAAMRPYKETYEYDGVGNFLSLVHRAMPSGDTWRRSYAYGDPSLIAEDAARSLNSNRLTQTTLSGGGLAGTLPEPYTHDVHGNMTSMPQLRVMEWTFKDQLAATQRQAVSTDDAEGTQRQGERTRYIYDASGQRVRKVTERASIAGAPPKRKDERIYLGGVEIYREYGGSAASLKLERQTLHIMDDKQRIALIETKTIDAGAPLTPAEVLQRYQFGNHLSSASLELDDQAQVISYEEYYPYGNTSYQAGRTKTQVRKRYRYTAKERDEESGLYYHGARYYAPWLARWMAADPLLTSVGINVYAYTKRSPISKVDPGGLQEKTYPLCDDELDAGAGNCPSVPGAKYPDTYDSVGDPAWTMSEEDRRKEQRPLATAGTVCQKEAEKGMVLAGPGKKELEWAKKEHAQGVKAGAFDATVVWRLLCLN